MLRSTAGFGQAAGTAVPAVLRSRREKVRQYLLHFVARGGKSHLLCTYPYDVLVQQVDYRQARLSVEQVRAISNMERVYEYLRGGTFCARCGTYGTGIVCSVGKWAQAHKLS